MRSVVEKQAAASRAVQDAGKVHDVQLDAA
jgi:hypothetical protein